MMYSAGMGGMGAHLLGGMGDIAEAMSVYGGATGRQGGYAPNNQLWDMFTLFMNERKKRPLYSPQTPQTPPPVYSQQMSQPPTRPSEPIVEPVMDAPLVYDPRVHRTLAGNQEWRASQAPSNQAQPNNMHPGLQTFMTPLTGYSGMGNPQLGITSPLPPNGYPSKPTLPNGLGGYGVTMPIEYTQQPSGNIPSSSGTGSNPFITNKQFPQNIEYTQKGSSSGLINFPQGVNPFITNR